MVTKRKTIAINQNVAITAMKKNDTDFVGLVSSDVVDGNVLALVQQSASQYEGIRSAVAYLYKATRIFMPKDMSKRLSNFIAGQRRTGVKEKQDLGLVIEEGKKPLTFNCYEAISKQLFYSDNKEHLFAHLFMVLDWCLMKRAENCVHAKINHIRFEHDSLVFEFSKSKGHQKGESHVGPWHVYSNPLKPWLCPVLSMACYLITYPMILEGNLSWFPGDNQYGRYGSLFAKVVKGMKNELKSR